MSIERGALRPAALAGRWYPGEADGLAAEVARLLGLALDAEGSSRAMRELAEVAFIVAPHAGMMYSGRTAAFAWAAAPAADTLERIVMVGPAHRVPFRGVALGDFAAFRIPTADVPVDRAALAGMEARAPELARFVPGAHDAEHCLEIQLPFAQARYPGTPIVPLLAGAVSAAELATVLEPVLGAQSLLVVSTDLSHFHPQEDARRRDLATLQAIAAIDPFELGGDDACGHRGVAASGIIAKRRGYRASLLHYSSSGDSGGDKDAVVGYGALALGPPA